MLIIYCFRKAKASHMNNIDIYGKREIICKNYFLYLATILICKLRFCINVFTDGSIFFLLCGFLWCDKYAALKSALNSKFPVSVFPFIRLSTCLLIISVWWLIVFIGKITSTTIAHMNVFWFSINSLEWGDKPECQSYEHFEVLLHAAGISICFSFWVYDGKLLNETGWLSWVVLLVDELNDQWKFCWKFSIGCCDVNEDWWNLAKNGNIEEIIIWYRII